MRAIKQNSARIAAATATSPTLRSGAPQHLRARRLLTPELELIGLRRRA
jgi:hypothetical protein